MFSRILCIFVLILLISNEVMLTFGVKTSLLDSYAKATGDPFSSDIDLLNQSFSDVDLQFNEENLEKQEIVETEGFSEESGWNFNDTSKWDEFAFIDGNLTKLIVGLKKEASLSEFQGIVKKHEAKIVDVIRIKGVVKAVVVELLLREVPSFVEDVNLSGLIEYVEPNLKVQAQMVPNDPYWINQWGPRKIEADWAWNITLGCSDVLVAIVDTGIDYSHPDLASNYVSLGYDWVNDDADPLDDFGHGTHCAGIVSAVINNSIGVSGLAQVKIMAEKVLDYYGVGYYDWIANGIVHAVDSGADIISMSLGGYGYSQILYDVVKYAYDSGVLLVAAAGNDNTNLKLYPAAFDEVIAVSATDQNDFKAYFSNWGEWIELAAPGVDIYSTMPTYHVTLNDWGYSMNYDYLSGTSMATPHVTGVAALAWSVHSNKTKDWIRLWLRYCAEDIGDPGHDVYYGYGRVNARKTVEQSPPAHEIIAYEWNVPPYIKPGSSGIINATILNFGDNIETNIAVELFVNETLMFSDTVPLLEPGNLSIITFEWVPVIEGVYNVTLYVVPVPGESEISNNILCSWIYVGFAVKAVVLHSAGNIVDNIVTNWNVLNYEWRKFGDVMVYVDYTTLNKDDISYQDIANTEADVLIISCAFDPYMGWQFTDDEIEAIKQYVYEGHGLLVTAGTFYREVPNNNKLASLLGLKETIIWDVVGTDLLHQQNISHPIFKKVPDPLVFPLAGSSLPSDGRWDFNELDGGKYVALGHFQESAIVTYKGLVYISPWLEVIPAYYHHHLQLLYNAIVWSRYRRPQHNLKAVIEAPNHLDPGSMTILNATVLNLGLSNETDVNLQLLIDGTVVLNQTVEELPANTGYTISYYWTPTVKKAYNVTAYVLPIFGEETLDDNVASKTVIVVKLAIKNALVYTDDVYTSPDQRYVILALDNLEVNYTHIFDDPWSFGSALLSMSWDLVIVDHCNWYSLGDFWSEIEEYVLSGGTLILSTFDIDGSNSEPTTLWNTLGVEYVSDMYDPAPVYRWNPSHQLFTFPNLVGDLTEYVGGYFDDGDFVEATTGIPLAGFTTSPSRGKAAIVEGSMYQTLLFSFILSEFRFDEDGDGKLDVVEMWENALVYMTARFEHDISVSIEAPAVLEWGNTAMLNATVRNKGLNNETDVELYLLINGKVKANASYAQLLVDETRTLSYLWTPPKPGIYNITVYAPQVPCENYTANNLVSRQTSVFYYCRFYLPNQWIGGGSPMSWHSDDSSWEYYLPFSFPFYGVYYQKIYVSSNGLITFDEPDADFGNSVSGLSEKLAIAPAWDDWVTYSPFDIYIWQNSTHVGIRWYVRHFGSEIVANFEVVLQDNGVIQFNYGFCDGPVSATIGISNGAGHIIAEDVTVINNIDSVVFTPFPPEHDLDVTLEAPYHLEPGESSLMNATVYNKGLNNETNVEFRIFIEGSVVNFSLIPHLYVGSSFTLRCKWNSTVEGTYNITAYATPVENESLTSNNLMTRFVRVRPIKYVLFDQTHSTDYIGNYLTWISSLESIGFRVSTHNIGPVTPEVLEGYDVFAIPQARSSYSASELSAVQEFVLEGGGLLVIGDDVPPVYTELTAFAGITWEEGGVSGVTTDITPHPTTAGVSSVYLPAPYALLYVSGDAQGIIRDSGGNIMFAVSEQQNGKVACLADEHLVEDRDIMTADNLVLAENIIDWLSTPILYEHEVLVRLEAPETVLFGMTILLNGTVRNLGLSNETNVEFRLYIDGEIKNSTVLPVLPSRESYLLSYRWTPLEEGTYNVTAYVSPVEGEENLENNVDTKMVWVTSSVIPELPSDRPAVYVNPLLSVVEPSETFTIAVSIFNLTNAYMQDPEDPSRQYPLGNLYGFDVQFTWDPNIIEYLGHTVTVPVEDYPEGVLHSPTFKIVEIVDENGNIPDAESPEVRAWFAYASALPAEPFNNPGVSVVFYMTFRAISQGFSPLELVSTTLACNDLANPEILHARLNGLVVVGAPPENRDVAILNVTSSPHAVYPNSTVQIEVLASNLGSVTESFDVTVYANTTVIDTQTVSDLPPGENITLTFIWNTTGLTPCSNFTIWAEATAVPGEVNLDNNRFTDGYVKIKMWCDINGDDVIDITDIVLAAASYGTRPGDPNWKEEADVAKPYGYIDICDIVTIASRYGMTP